MTEHARGDDPVWWAPPGTGEALDRYAERNGGRVHRCATAVVVAQVPRDQLDYMALNLCRYCDEPMPA